MQIISNNENHLVIENSISLWGVFLFIILFAILWPIVGGQLFLILGFINSSEIGWRYDWLIYAVIILFLGPRYFKKKVLC